ncbi:MAG: hypothetical protein IAA16_05160 [Candidatus Treponema excrementipullorum]|uniref:Uncharacterized protein n=1 Tax=Candidatus Treponema excrementipullorum TaxID=2838768 RepID=A0A9E2L2R2_9SPIR|nr:hypothetical protein [Candidatus Treponema excrementipullorum]
MVVVLRKILFYSCLFVFPLFSCGLDTFYYLNHPIRTHFIDAATSAGDSSDPSLQYFEFRTVDTAGDVYQGTAVYYKIYNDPQKLQSERIAIENYNEEYSDRGINTLRSYNYKLLSTTEITSSNLVTKNDGVTDVMIYLYDTTAHKPEVIIGGTSRGIPVRENDGYFTFDNNDTSADGKYKCPQENDSDYTYTAGVTTEAYYVAAFAVATGMNTSLTPIYSQVEYLGSLKITPKNATS